LHESYSSLGRDFKNIFEDLMKHLNEQKAQAQDLRSRLRQAASTAMEAEVAASLRLESILEAERRQGVSDRQELLRQIGSLLATAGEQQDVRLSSKVEAVQQDISSNRTTFEKARGDFNTGMSNWDQKEVVLFESVLKSREVIKTKLKKDWLVSWRLYIPLYTVSTDKS
jgi:kinesin family protein 11